VPDPYDDSIIWWGTVREGEPPKQLVEGGEYFVLKKIAE
jgi:cytochrome c oxidase subunit 5b